MQQERAAIGGSNLPPPGTVVGGRYCVEELIGCGGMGAVLAATHRVTGRRVALKWLLHDPDHDAELTQRLVREARAAGRVRHENVVDVYDVGEHDGSLFLVMELLEGRTLSAHLEEHGVLPPPETLDILLPVMRGVQAAHESGVIHRDLKPGNIFLCRETGSVQVKPRVLDFGVSKIGKGIGDEQSLTQSGAVMGTPYYMAPEQLADGHVDARSDVYALGVIAYQCLTGRLPYEARTFSAMVTQVATRDPVPISSLRPGLPQRLCATVMCALARDPAARIPSVTAFIEALTAATAPSPPVQATMVDPGAPAPSSKWRLAAAGLAAVAAAVGGWSWYSGVSRAPDASAPPAPALAAAPEPLRPAALSVPAASAPDAREPGSLPPAPAVAASPPPASAAPSARIAVPAARRQKRVTPAPGPGAEPKAPPATRSSIKVSPDQF